MIRLALVAIGIVPFALLGWQGWIFAACPLLAAASLTPRRQA